MLTIREGSTFCICDDRGGVVLDSNGLFAQDPRRLSRFVLTVNGARPLLLSSGQIQYYSAAFYLRNPVQVGLEHDVLSIVRSRFVSEAMQERIAIRNESMVEQRFQVALELGSDFADIFAVKDHDFTLGDPEHASALPPLAPATWADDGTSVSFADEEDSTLVTFSREGRADDGKVRWMVELGPRESWEVVVDVFPFADSRPKHTDGHFG